MSNFRELVSLANEYLECYTNLPLTKIQERIQQAYEEDEIDGSQYDYLIGLLKY